MIQAVAFDFKWAMFKRKFLGRVWKDTFCHDVNNIKKLFKVLIVNKTKVNKGCIRNSLDLHSALNRNMFYWFSLFIVDIIN